MAPTVTNASSVERSLHTSDVERASTDATRESNDGFDFPPTAHPGRELFTFCLFILLSITLLAVGWLEANFVDIGLTACSQREGRSQAMRFTVTSGLASPKSSTGLKARGLLLSTSSCYSGVSDTMFASLMKTAGVEAWRI